MTATPTPTAETAVEAVTFDFWNTLMWEEPGSLREKRLEVWARALADAGSAVDPDRLAGAHDAAHLAYVDSWTAGRQFRVEEAIDQMLAELDGSLVGDARQALVEGFSDAGRCAAIHPSPGVRECLEALRGAGVRIGIICDIGLTPSPVIVELLERYRLHQFFDAMVFSDRVGYYKPAREVFEHALAALGGVRPERAIHVGDRRRTDVGGAKAMGMTSVRYTGAYEDHHSLGPDADYVTADLMDLPSLLDVAVTAS